MYNVKFRGVVLLFQTCKLRLQPPSGSDLPAHSPFLPPSAITQVMLIANPNKVSFFFLGAILLRLKYCETCEFIVTLTVICTIVYYVVFSYENLKGRWHWINVCRWGSISWRGGVR